MSEFTEYHSKRNFLLSSGILGHSYIIYYFIIPLLQKQKRENLYFSSKTTTIKYKKKILFLLFISVNITKPYSILISC